MKVANVEMAQAWDGAEGANWAEHAEHYERSAARYNPHLFEAARISSGDDVLDIGCGNGGTTIEAARIAVDGHALGVDLSSQMLERARERARAEGVDNARFEQADAQVHPFDEGAFDCAISRFGAMFFGDSVAAFRNIARALRSGGRLGLLGWRDMKNNEWLSAIRNALAAGRDLPEPPVGAPGPFGLADADRVRATLREAGYVDVEINPVEEPLQFGTDAEDAFGFLSSIAPVQGMLKDLDEATTRRALDDLRSLVKAHETSDGVLFGSSAYLVTARRP